jgi:hypothetical protein
VLLIIWLCFARQVNNAFFWLAKVRTLFGWLAASQAV